MSTINEIVDLYVSSDNTKKIISEFLQSFLGRSLGSAVSSGSADVLRLVGASSKASLMAFPWSGVGGARVSFVSAESRGEEKRGSELAILLFPGGVHVKIGSDWAELGVVRRRQRTARDGADFGRTCRNSRGGYRFHLL